MSIVVHIEPPFEPSVDSQDSGINTFEALKRANPSQPDPNLLRVESIPPSNLNSFRTIFANSRQSVRASHVSKKSVKTEIPAGNDSCRCAIW
jgi:hypothetical protein